MSAEEVMQGSPEWKALRCGKVTASRISDITAKTKTGPAASRANYMAELIAERLTGTPAEHFTNAAMAWGNEKEPDAANAYAFYRDAELATVAFVPHPSIAMSGASPDRLVGADGLVEIKCPNTATHIETLLGGEVPKKYREQMQWQMACTGRKWCDFASYDPRMPQEMSLFVKRVERDDVLIASLETEVRAFIAEMESKIAALNAAYSLKEAA